MDFTDTLKEINKKIMSMSDFLFLRSSLRSSFFSIFIILLFVIISFSNNRIYAQSSFYINQNATVKVSQNAILRINGNLTISSGAVLMQDANNIIALTGDFENNGTLSNNNDTILFTGNIDQNIKGTQLTQFRVLSINKTSGKVNLLTPTRIEQSLRLISNSIFDLTNNDLTVSPTAKIYSDNGITEDYTTFSANKCIVNSGSSTDPLEGAYLIKELPTNPSFPYEAQFPISTPGVYTPLRIRILANGATFGSNPSLKVKPVPLEHPEVEVPNVSLQKYWVISSNDINLNTKGAEIFGYYSASEVEGNEGSYRVLLFAPSWNSPDGYWRIEPGVNNYVDFNAKYWYSQQTSILDGDWTIGEANAGQATYFARADGDYNNPNTWSKIYYDGAPSTTIPNKRSDRIKIQNHTVTISNSIAPANLVAVETGTEGRSSGILKIQSDNIVIGDTFRLENNAKLFIGHTQGIDIAPNLVGTIQTDIRQYSTEANYGFWGGNSQVSGPGIPDIIRSFIVEKDPNTTVLLSKNSAITDSLVINSGILDLQTNSLNGYTSNRALRMRGGEMIVRADFPLNYAPPSFEYGTITFDGEGNAVIPSSGSTPGVLKYNDLSIKGNRAGNITFQTSGEIRLKNDFDISELNFNSAAYGFQTAGSTVRFLKNGPQSIPFQPASPVDSLVNIRYYNLIVDSAGVKEITGSNSSTFVILNNLRIEGNAEFKQNNPNIEIQGNWNNILGKFIPNPLQTVIFTSPSASINTTITTRDTLENPFENVLINGTGGVKPLDNLLIKGNLTFAASSNLFLENTNLFLQKNWINNGGNFSATNSRVVFEGNSPQSMSKTNGNETFWDIELNNSANLNFNSVGTTNNNGIIANNNLHLTNGRVDARDRFIQVNGQIFRPGGGYINSTLRRYIDTGTVTLQYEVGYENSYTPITLAFNGMGGARGIIQVLADTISTTTSPISWADATPSEINPTGSQISPLKHIARQWNVTIPSGSSFSLGDNRKYNATAHFINGIPPNSDLRNGTEPSVMNAVMRTSSQWIQPLQYGSYPYVVKYNDSTRFAEMIDFGTIMLGEPGVLTFFTRGNGNWNDPANWSLVSYDGAPSSVYPGQNTNVFQAYIGKNHNITLNTNITVDTLNIFKGKVIVDSSGILDLSTNVIAGNGEFRLTKYGTIQIGDANGINTTGETGNIRTYVRNYNYNSHNLGTFIYSGSGAQNSGTGLPSGADTTNVLIIDKPSGNLTINASNTLHIKDSLYIKSGGFNLGYMDLHLYGNMRKASGASFQHNNRTVVIKGISSDTLTSENYNEGISFYNLTISKSASSGNVLLDTLTWIQIDNNLTFSNNKSVIDATSKKSETYPPFVTFGISATVTGADHYNTSQYGGWIYGEVRKNIPAGDAPVVIFETGTQSHYAPYRINFASGSGSSAGYLGVYAIDGFHPKLYSSPASLYPINPNRVITNYWKVKKIKNSTFVRGNRNYTARVDLVNPDKATLLDCFGCADLAYYRGGDSLQWWQPLYANGTGENNDLSNGLCGDTRFSPPPTPNFSYNGTACGSTSIMAYIQVNNVTTSQAFGNQEVYANGDTLLADFVAGNRNSIKYYNFYSINNGDWTDPNTWSTVSYFSTVNEAATDPDPLIKPFPVRQYDNVLIGNNKKVTLNTNIGHNDYRSTSSNNVHTYVGPSVSVENTGTLIFGTRVLRGNTFNAFKGSTIVIGSLSGINTGIAGNIIHGQYGAEPKYNDTINVIYTAEGRTVNIQQYSVVNRNATTHYLERLIMKKNSDGTTILDNFTGTTERYSSYGHNFQFHKKAVLTAGQSYYIQVNPSNNTTNRRIRMWIDMNYNGIYTDTGEQLVNMTTGGDTISVQSAAFTIPANILQGTTQMRVGIRNNNNNFGPTDDGTGEFEEYTIDIVNPNGVFTQVSGTAIPGKLASLQVNSTRDSSTVELQKSIEVVDSVKITSGILKASNGANNYNIKVVKDFINDTINGFNAASAEVEFFGIENSRIRGSQPITFNKLKFNKTYQDSLITIANNVYINDSLNFISTNKAIVNDNIAVTFNQNSELVGNFSNAQMFKVSGNPSGGTLVKIFPSSGGTANFKQFLFPIGFDTIYNPVRVYDTAATYAGLPQIEIKLINGKHPNRLTDNILNRYWNIYTQNFNNIDSLKFYYHKANVLGDTTKYIPSLWQSTFWQIDVGINPWAKSSPILINNTLHFNGDWTAGGPEAFSKGKIYYSRNSGNWDNHTNWSTDNTLKHSGPPSSYWPGLLFESDTVNIDGNNIVFNLDSCRIDSLRIGGTNPSPDPGVLQFGTNFTNKRLFTRQVFLDNDNGSIVQNTGVSTVDTLFISQNLNNNSSSGIFLQDASTNHKLSLKFILTGNSIISGNGIFSKINSVILNKSGGLNDSLIISSIPFADSSMTSTPSFIFNSGVLVNNISDTLLISNPSFNVELKPSSAIYLKQGRIHTKSNLTLFANSNITIDGGILDIGDNSNEHLLYQTGSRINLINGEINISGGLIRQNPSSYPEINISNNSIFRVAKIGNSTADPSFDVRSVNSILNMNGGRIIVANSNPNANADIEINAENGTLMQAGTIQVGDSLFTSTNNFRVAGSMPIYDLHLVSPNDLNNYNSQIASLNYIVNNNIYINQRQTLNLNGNILNLKGNLSNYGNLNATPAASTTQPWRILLDGVGDQYFKNFNLSIPELEIYSLSLNKTTGNFLLGDNDTTTNSSVKINDNLEFQTDNLAYIDANSFNQKVIVGPNSAGLGLKQITRNTLGHIYGTLSIYLPNGAQTRIFPIGADTIHSFRPATLEITGENNTSGYLDVQLHNSSHPDTANSGLAASSIILQYWTVQPAQTNGFQLGSAGKYKITTQFINPGDIPSEASIGLFEHRLHTPAYPPAATWIVPEFISNSDTTVVSRNVTQWGDFIIGNPGIVTFYSYADGDWQNTNSWSLSGYTIYNPPSRIPNENTDVVRIGNGKKITLQNGTYPTVRNVIVETYNGLPGYFQINGDLNYFRGLSFNLENNNTLGIQHVDGIRPESEGNIGPIQTNARIYGTSRYIFNSAIGNQQTGTGLPNYVKTIISDNSSTTANRKVFLSNYVGAPTINIIDTLLIRQGTFSGGNRNLRILNSFILDSNNTDGIFEPLSGKVIFDSTINHYIILKNRSGVNFYDLELNQGLLFANREGINLTDSTHIYVQDNLNFVNPGIIILGDEMNLFIKNPATNAITNFSSNKYIRTSRSSGLLIRAISNGALPKTYTFPIGSYETADHYTPAEITIQSVNQPGQIGSRVSPGDVGGFPGGHSHISTSPLAQYLKRYWVIDSVQGDFTAKARFNYLDTDLFGTETNLDRLGRWRPPFEQANGYWLSIPVPTVDYTLNFFETQDNYSFNELRGDWTLGNIFAFKRIFYSRQSGNWNDPNSWTYDPSHSGPVFGPGIWPDNSQDSVIIGGGIGANPPHEITLNLNANVMGTALGLDANDKGILNTLTNTLLGEYFTMGEFSHLKIGSPDGISLLGENTGNILTTQSRYFNTNGIYEYNGSENQIIGTGLPNTANSLIINNSGALGNNIVLVDRNINIQSDLSILQGTLDLQTYSANNATSSGTMSISPNAYLKIGGNNSLFDAINNYSVYNIDIDSYIEFYGGVGNSQEISHIPTNLINGLGNVLLSNGGVKIAMSPLLIRGNLVNQNPSILNISVIDALQVRKNVINESQIFNQGVLEIGF